MLLWLLLPRWGEVFCNLTSKNNKIAILTCIRCLLQTYIGNFCSENNILHVVEYHQYCNVETSEHTFYLCVALVTELTYRYLSSCVIIYVVSIIITIVTPPAGNGQFNTLWPNLHVIERLLLTTTVSGHWRFIPFLSVY